MGTRNPADILERRQERELGCWLCVHSRADSTGIRCAMRHLTAGHATEKKFPLIGVTCVEFKRREEM